jgi:hypothetical protein
MTRSVLVWHLKTLFISEKSQSYRHLWNSERSPLLFQIAFLLFRPLSFDALFPKREKSNLTSCLGTIFPSLFVRFQSKWERKGERNFDLNISCSMAGHWLNDIQLREGINFSETEFNIDDREKKSFLIFPKMRYWVRRNPGKQWTVLMRTWGRIHNTS